MEYKYIFSTSKNLSQNPSPHRVFLLMDLARNAWKDIKPIIVDKFGKYCKDLEYLFLVDLLDNTIPLEMDIYSIFFWSGEWESYLEGIFRA